ncbi:hypothetical protein HDU93_005283 [Gonapodya sp. JEL0774]|nr:hypothetical protein HDU93_005283 [Gonapodya sp. JEL0774]
MSKRLNDLEIQADDHGIVLYDVVRGACPITAMLVTPVLDVYEAFTLRIGEAPGDVFEGDDVNSGHLQYGNLCGLVVPDHDQLLSNRFDLLTLRAVIKFQEARCRRFLSLEDQIVEFSAKGTGGAELDDAKMYLEKGFALPY